MQYRLGYRIKLRLIKNKTKKRLGYQGVFTIPNIELKILYKKDFELFFCFESVEKHRQKKL